MTQAPTLAANNLAEAMRLAARGWAVFPVAPGTKRPYAGGTGCSEATMTPDRVREWWTERPNADIGVNAGMSSLVVVDVDIKGGGPVSLGGLVERNGPIPDTVTAQTPGGGFHLFFKQPATAIRNRVGIWPGVDIRAANGYVVVAPSVHPNGEHYAWREGRSPFDLDPAEMPEWLVSALAEPKAAPTLAAATQSGERNARLTSLAGALRARGVDEAGLIAGLRGLNTATCQPPLEDREVLAIAASIGKRPAGQTGLTERKRSFALLTRADLGDLPSVEWLIDGVVPAAGVSVLYGPSGGGKTFCALSMAYAVSVGIDWLSRATMPGPVVYVAAEGRSGLRARVEALEREHGLRADSLRVLPEAVQLGRDADVTAFADAVAAMPQPPALIVVDTLARCLVGGDENSAKDVGLFVAGVDRLRETFGCAVLVVHHSGKGGDTYRGSSALVGAADSVMRFEGSGGILTLQCEKQKDAEPFGRINALLMQSGDSCLVVLSDGTAPTAAAPATRRVAEVLGEIAGDDWSTRRDLEKACGMPPSTFAKALKAAHECGLVEKEGESRGQRFRLRRVSESESL